VDPFAFRAPSGGNHISWQILAALATPALCSLLLLAAAPAPAHAQPLQLEQQLPPVAQIIPAGTLVSVQGVVLNAATGQPLPRALVRIEGDASTGALTDGEGRFLIPSLPLGPQEFQVIKPGFRDPSATGNDSEHNVLVAAEMPDLVFTLLPESSISGQVGLSTGDPAEMITVNLLRLVVLHGRAEWATVQRKRTDAEGFYRFGELRDGTYTVACSPSPESMPAGTLIEPDKSANIELSGYALTYYPNARQMAGAGKIRLGPGEQVQANIDLTLEPFYPVTATILVPNAGGTLLSAGPADNPVPPTPMLLDSDYHLAAYLPRYDAATQTVQAVLPDGNYALTLTVPAPAISAAETFEPTQGLGFRRPNYFTGMTVFSVAGQAIKNLRIPLFAPPGYPLHLRAQSDSLAQSGAFPTTGLSSAMQTSLAHAGEPLLKPDDESGMFADGPDSFDLMRAPLFSYWVHTMVYGKGLCAGELTASGINLAREPLILSFSGPPGPMEFTLRNDCARLNLSLPAALTAFRPGIEPVYTVYVVPDFDTTEDVRPVTLRPSSGGTLTLQQLSPGNYHVFTFMHPVELEYRNPAAMARLPNAGQPVTLPSGGDASLVLEVPEP